MPNSNQGNQADNQAARGPAQQLQQQQQMQQMQAGAIQPSPSMPHTQAQAAHLINPGFAPPRSIPTPQQNIGQPPSQASGSPFNALQGQLPGQFPFGSNPQSQSAGPSQPNQIGVSNAQQGAKGFLSNSFQPNGMPIPLDKTRFDSLFKGFCAKSNLKPDPRLLNLDNRPVELHRLHVEVMKEGGFAKVSRFILKILI